MLAVVAVAARSSKECIVSEALSSLDCTDSHVTVVPIHLLSNVTKTLLLSNNFLTVVPTEALAAVPNLQILDLKSNFLTSIGNASFSLTPKLRELFLGGNFYLKELHVGAFEYLGELTKLSIRVTGITTFSRSHFAPLSSLRILLFDFNYYLLAPPPDLFAGLTTVVHVELSASGDASAALATRSLGLTNMSLL